MGLFILVIMLLAINTYESATVNKFSNKRTAISSKTIINKHINVSNVSYNLSHNGYPTTLDNVTFDITVSNQVPGPTEVHVKLVSTTDTWFGCTARVGIQWSCNISGVTVSAIDELNVVATY